MIHWVKLWVAEGSITLQRIVHGWQNDYTLHLLEMMRENVIYSAEWLIFKKNFKKSWNRTHLFIYALLSLLSLAWLKIARKAKLQLEEQLETVGMFGQICAAEWDVCQKPLPQTKCLCHKATFLFLPSCSLTHWHFSSHFRDQFHFKKRNLSSGFHESK